MKNLKNVLSQLLLLSISFVSSLLAEAESSLTSDLSTEASTAAPEKNTEPIVSDATMKQWQSHMASLLEKGVFWDIGNNVPTNDWKDEAFAIAHTIIIANPSQADQLKESFNITINDKIELEKGTHSIFTAALITDFTDHIQEWLQPTPIEPVKSEPNTEQITTPESTEVGTTENAPIEESTEPSGETTQEEKEWQSYLQDFANHDYDSESIDEAITKAYTLAQKTLTNASPEDKQKIIDRLKEEFKKTIEAQAKEKGFGGVDPETIINQFSAKLDEAVSPQEASEELQKKEEEPFDLAESNRMLREQMPFTPSEPTRGTSTTQVTQRTTTEQQQQTTATQASEPQSPVYSESQAQQYYTPENPLRSTTVTSSEKETEKEEDPVRQRAIKKAVLQKIQQKAALEAQKKQNIIASLMEKVFNVDVTTWFGGEATRISEVPDIIETVLQSEPDPAKRLLKKNAYLLFQTTLLDFNSKEFWNAEAIKPNDAWLDKIKNELAILTSYKMITIPQALEVVDITLQTNIKITEEIRTSIKANIQKFLETLRTAKQGQQKITAQKEAASLSETTVEKDTQ